MLTSAKSWGLGNKLIYFFRSYLGVLPLYHVTVSGNIPIQSYGLPAKMLSCKSPGLICLSFGTIENGINRMHDTISSMEFRDYYREIPETLKPS